MLGTSISIHRTRVYLAGRETRWQGVHVETWLRLPAIGVEVLVSLVPENEPVEKRGER